MALPHFLIIGAMKAGSTTLWEDLRRQPEILMPASKEPETLGYSDAATRRGKRRYAALFRQAAADQICGEASTLYTKLPHSRAIAARARQLLGSELRLIYVVREPIERAISHHKHLWRRRKVAAEFDQAVRQRPEIIEYGCYARQIEPWLEQFSRHQLLMIRFESLVDDREATLARVMDFLGLPPPSVEIDEQAVFNLGEVDRMLHVPGFDDWFYNLRMTHAYQRLSQFPLISRLKEPVKARFQRPLPPGSPSAPSPSMLEDLIARYEHDMPRLADYLDCEAPVWDLRERYG